MDDWKTHVVGGGDEYLHIPGFELKVVRGPDKGKTASSTSAELVVGTQAGADLCLTDPTVSRNHCAIEVRPEGFRVRDLGSTNGTIITGIRIVECFVPKGCQLELGQSSIKLTARAEGVEVPLHSGERFGPLLGRSHVMRQTFARLKRAAQSDGTILIQGETGTGKDLAAEAVHLASARASAPFVVVDCSAIPAALIESELFGHEKGAFTGAIARRVGAFESAHRGTLFLDEIGELPLDLQPKLLRVLEKRVIKPVGSTSGREVDIRIIAATHRDLRAEVNRGKFREDLFYRLSVIPVRMPPLRERGEDIALLAETFFRDLAPSGRTIPPALSERLLSSDWPGNVRQLRNAVEQAIALGEIESEAVSRDDNSILPFKLAKRRLVERFEQPYLERLIAAADGNVSAAARAAGLDRVHLLKLLRQYGLR